MFTVPSRPAFSRFKGKNKFYLTPYKYDINNPYPTETVYISPRKPDVIRYISGFLLRIKQTPNHLCIYRPVYESSRMLKIGVCIRRYNKDNKTNDQVTFQNYEFEYRDECHRIQHMERYDTVGIRMAWPDDFCYATVDIMIMMIDTIENKSTITKEIGSKKTGFGYLDFKGGSIRVYKEILSNEVDYFKKLFEGKKKRRYKLDVDIEDMIEVIYCLPPFNRPIRSGWTYGALHRLSDKFVCWKLADMGENYISRIRRYAPYIASYISYEAHIIGELALFFEILKNDRETLITVALEHFIRDDERKQWLSTGNEYDPDCRYKHTSVDEIVREL